MNELTNSDVKEKTAQNVCIGVVRKERCLE